MCSCIQALIAAACPFAAAAEELKLALIGPLTGPGKAYGEACKNGFELAREELGLPFRMLYEDDQGLPAKTVGAFKKLVEVDGADVVAVVGSSGSNAVAPLAEKARVPLLAWASDTAVSRGRAMVIRTYTSGFREGELLAKEAIKGGTARTAFINATGDYPRSVGEGVKAALPSEILVDLQEYPPEAQDFRTYLMRIKGRGVKRLGLCLNPGQSGLIARQAKELGYTPQFFGCETLHDTRELDVSQGALEGAWFETVWIDEDFRRRYAARFGNQDVISGAAVHYEAARLLSEKSFMQLRGRELIAALAAANDERQSVIGRYRLVQAGGDRYFDIPLVIRRITSRGFEE